MTQQRFHSKEKRQVQVATAVGLLAVYFGLWALVRNWEPEAPITFVLYGAYDTFARLFGIVMVLAVLCAAVTVGSRPAGAMAATLLGIGAVSLRSPSARVALWTYEGKLGSLFGGLIAEVLLLALVVTAAGLVVAMVRLAARRIRPKWCWQPPEGQAPELAEEYEPPTVAWQELSPLLWALLALARRGRAEGSADRRLATRLLLRSLYAVGMGVPITVAVLFLVMQSSDRGQILFALLVGCGLAAWVSHRTFPVDSIVPAVATAIVSAILLYGLCGIRGTAGGHEAWMKMGSFAQALPIDWVSAGGGGAALGVWVSERWRESRELDRSEQEGKGS